MMGNGEERGRGSQNGRAAESNGGPTTKPMIRLRLVPQPAHAKKLYHTHGAMQ